MTTDERKEYNRKYYSANREYYSAYSIKNGKKYREAKKRNCIYKLINKNGNVVYIGSTSSFKVRFSNHCDCNSSLKLTQERWNELEGDYWQVAYTDVNREELFYIEYLLVNDCKDKCLVNKDFKFNSKIIISEDRKHELLEVSKGLVFTIFKNSKFKL